MEFEWKIKGPNMTNIGTFNVTRRTHDLNATTTNKLRRQQSHHHPFIGHTLPPAPPHQTEHTLALLVKITSHQNALLSTPILIAHVARQKFTHNMGGSYKILKLKLKIFCSPLYSVQEKPKNNLELFI